MTTHWIWRTLVAGVAVAACGTARGAVDDVRINEIRADQPGNDDDEYIELTGPANQSLDGLWFISINDTLNAEDQPRIYSGGIQMVIDLSGRQIAPDGFFLMAKDTFGTGSLMLPGTPDWVVPNDLFTFLGNSDNFTYLLVTEFTGSNGLDIDSNALPEFDNDGVLDSEPWTDVVDGIATVEEFPPLSGGADWVYPIPFTTRPGNVPIVGPAAGLFAPAQVYRSMDGAGTWQIGSFSSAGVDTPGSSNTSIPVSAAQGVSVVQQDVTSTINVEGGNPVFGDPVLCAFGTFQPFAIRLEILPCHGDLSDDNGIIMAASLPYTVVGDLDYTPSNGFSGVDEFEFVAVDTNLDDSNQVLQEIAVQGPTSVVITEVMYSPVGDDDQYQFIEVYNTTASPVQLLTIDNEEFEISQAGGAEIDTTGNLAGCTVPAGGLMYLAPDASTIGLSMDDFLCEWRLAASDVCFVPLSKWESIDVNNGSNCIISESDRLLLFDSNGVLVDAVPLDIPGDVACRDTSRALDSEFLFPEEVDNITNNEALAWACADTLAGGMTVPGENASRTETQLDGSEQITRSIANPGFVLSGVPSSPFSFEESCIGACCLPDGTCEELTDQECRDRTCNLAFGSYTVGSACDAVSCTAFPVSGCCLSTGDCLDTNECDCQLNGGTFDGANECAGIASCPATVTLAFNEIDYNEPGTDTSEFIELIGTPGGSLLGFDIVLFNGADCDEDNDYRMVDLSAAGSIPSNGFLVIGSAQVDNVDLISWAEDGIQNDGAFPDGMLLTVADSIVVDDLAYGDSGFNAINPDVGTIGLTPLNTADTLLGTLQRIPDEGAYLLTPNRTPGESNFNAGEVLGACCLPTGSCVNNESASSCAAQGGAYNGDGSRCPSTPEFIDCLNGPNAGVYEEGYCVSYDYDADVDVDLRDAAEFELEFGDCPAAPTGACCRAVGLCEIDNQFDCEVASGIYQGDGTVCDGSCPPPAIGTVLVNEFWADQAGADDVEYLELFGTPGADLTGLSLLVVDGDSGGSETSSNFRNVKVQVDLTGQTLDSNGFLTIGNSQNPPGLTFDLPLPGNLENGSQTYALVPTDDLDFCTGAGAPDASCNGGNSQLTQASYDALVVSAVDAVATLDDDAGDDVYFGAPVLQDQGNAANSAQRIPNGTDTDSSGDWEIVNLIDIPPFPPAVDPSTEGAINRSFYQSGACCTGQDCRVLTDLDCTNSNGVLQGIGTECGSPSVCECITIADFRTLPDGTPAFLCDVVVSSATDMIQSSCCFNFQLQDDTAGITGFGSEQDVAILLAGAPVGTQIDIAGELGGFASLLQIDTLTLVNNDGFVGAPVSQIVTAAEFVNSNAVAESLESEIVTVECVEFVGIGGACDPLPVNFPGVVNFCVSPVDSTDIFTVRVSTTNQDFTGTKIPLGPVTITGVFSQFDFGDGTGGYQILMRNTDDISECE